MKKLSAILLVCLLTLHFAGCYFVYLSINNNIERTWAYRFVNDDFNDTQLEEMSLPISFPYMADQEDFIHVDEQMEIDGKVYRIVKKRYAQDTLHLQYVNDQKMEDLNAFYSQWKEDLQEKDKSSHNQVSLNLSINYHYYSYEFQFKALNQNNSALKHQSRYEVHFDNVYLDTTTPPPKIS